MAWLVLFIAIAFELAATSALKLSDGLTRVGPTVVVVLGYIISFVLLARALKMQLQVSVAYAVWSGVGTAAIVVIAAVFLHEPLTSAKLLGVTLIIGGVVILNLAGSA